MMARKQGEIRMGRLEMKIMHVVWDKGTACVHDVKDVLGKGRKPAYTTCLRPCAPWKPRAT